MEGQCALEGLEDSVGAKGVTGQQVLKSWSVDVESGYGCLKVAAEGVEF